MVDDVESPAGAAVELPDDWEVSSAPAEGASLVALEPEAEGREFRANIVLTEVSVGGLSFGDWQQGTEEILDRLLDDYLVVDLERLEIEGRPAGRRLAHYAGPHGEALTMEQWFVLLGDTGHTLTATVTSGRYDELADLVAAVASSWRPTSPGGPDAD